LVLLNALFASEEHKSVPHVKSIVLGAVVFNELVNALVDTVLVTAVISVQFCISAL
jgi:hypothetical protein